VREELRHYQRHKKQAAVSEMDVILASPVNETPGIQNGGPGDPVGSRASALAQNKTVAQKRERVRWIDDTLPSLESETRQVLQMLLVDGRYTATGVAFELHMSERNVYYLANKGLLALALAYWDEGIIFSRSGT